MRPRAAPINREASGAVEAEEVRPQLQAGRERKEAAELQGILNGGQGMADAQGAQPARVGMGAGFTKCLLYSAKDTGSTLEAMQS